MLSVIATCALSGIDVYPITVEVDIAPGLPGFTMVGLPDSAVKEARERVFAALKNSGFTVPSKRITVNLAPGGIRKEGTAFDMPLALGILLASGQLEPLPLEGFLFLGELSLDGNLRPVRGVLSAAIYAKQSGLAGLVVPMANRDEAVLVEGVGVFGAGNLLEALDFLRRPVFPDPGKGAWKDSQAGEELDFAEVKGQANAKRALEVAAAGAHNFLLVGSPGCGKTLLARRLPSILPPLSEEEALETTRVYSVAGMMKSGESFPRRRPFRSPHHSISLQAMVGGSGWSRPGEISLAHNGVLFLDELPEFHRDVIESLRQPLEEGEVTISRSAQTILFPCKIMLGVALNPCPCGFLMDRHRRCVCRMEEIMRYRARLSGPLLDRIDLHLELPGLEFSQLVESRPGESSSVIRERVGRARGIQRTRFRRDGGPGIFCNAFMSGEQLRKHCVLTPGTKKLIRKAVETLGLSARAFDRILKVGRTIADLDASPVIREQHVAEAVHYRSLDRELSPFPL
ncbi:MAG TPA: YifB family Mg chelatase-like AAA ATPase [Fibrobacteria bacterium]|nr:YifB family Mg chelatase-like AAA ATPase [Fibrobacteria bacterium]